MKTSSLGLTSLIGLCLAFGVQGCVVVPGSGDDGTGQTSGDPSSESKDETQFTSLEKKLDGSASQAFDSSVSELETEGAAVYFKTFPGYDPVLHRLGQDDKTTNYGFSIGTGDDYNDRVTDQAVATAENTGDTVTYHVYDATQADSEISTYAFPAPSDEQKWYAYAISGTTLYVLTTPGEQTSQTNDLWAIAQGGKAEKVLSLEEAGIQPGEIWDMDVSGSTMMLIEQGRLWRIDLKAHSSAFLQNQSEITGNVDFEADGVTWEDADGLKFYDLQTHTLRDLSSELQNADYEINATYNDAHYFYDKTSGNDFTRYGDWVLYSANVGIFAYNLKDARINPILIDSEDDNDHRVDYVYPVAAADGTAFFVALTSDDGALGADGPVVDVDLQSILGG